MTIFRRRPQEQLWNVFTSCTSVANRRRHLASEIKYNDSRPKKNRLPLARPLGQITVNVLFLARISTLTRDIDIAILSVRPSVRPWCSGSLLDENGWTLGLLSQLFFSPHGSPIILVLSASNTFTKFRQGHPLRGAKYRWGIKISRFSTDKSLSLSRFKIAP